MAVDRTATSIYQMLLTWGLPPDVVKRAAKGLALIPGFPWDQFVLAASEPKAPKTEGGSLGVGRFAGSAARFTRSEGVDRVTILASKLRNLPPWFSGEILAGLVQYLFEKEGLIRG